ncbi:DUF2155 domain-containing protein [Pseudoroseicyclus sp. H15]
MSLRLPLALCAAAGLALASASASAQQVAEEARGGVVRVLDKITGSVTDITLMAGETQAFGHLSITLGECRYPTSNPSGDAFAWLVVHYQNAAEPVFRGWMIASAPALNPMDHPRYDVWPLSCLTDGAAPPPEEEPLSE